MRPGIAGILTFLFANPGYMPSPAKIMAGKCEITQAVSGIESKAPQFHGTARMMLRSKYGP